MTPEEIKVAIETLENLWRTSQNQEAKAFAYELLENPAIQEDPESLTRVYNSLGLVYFNLSDLPKALEYSSKALQINEEIGNKKGIAANLGNLGNIYNKLSDNPKALECYSKALHISEEIGNKAGIAAALANIGLVYSNLSDYPKALEYYSKALLINEEIGNKVGIAVNFGNSGLVYIYLSDFPKALEYYTKSLLINEEIVNKVGIASNLGNIGLVYHNLSDYPKALEYYSKALHINEEIGNKDGIAKNLGNIGLVYYKLFEYSNVFENYSKALEYFSKSLHFCQEIGNKSGVANNLMHLGVVYFHLSDYKKALKNYLKALQINEEIGVKKGIASALGNIGVVYSSKESTLYDVKKAEEYFQKTLVLAEEIGARYIIKETYEQLHILRLNQEHYKEALEFHLKSIALEKEIQSIEVKKQAERFDSVRKIAEREKQLAVERARYEERENILRNILPDSVTDRLVKGENPIADHFETASVLFMDLVGFTTLASIAPPKQLVYLLDAIFQKADEVVEQYGLEKIKTIGDGYLAVANVTSPLVEHQKATALAALQLLETMKDFTVNIPNDLGDTNWITNMNEIEIRIGIHTGEVVAGIIGKNKYTYDLWGDAVNIASRMESNSEPGRINISEQFAKSIESYPEFSLIPRGEITIKGKGTMNTFWLEKGKI